MSEIVSIRLSDPIFAVLQARAAALGSTPTAVARQLLTDALNAEAGEARLAARVLAGVEPLLIAMARSIVRAQEMPPSLKTEAPADAGKRP